MHNILNIQQLLIQGILNKKFPCYRFEKCLSFAVSCFGIPPFPAASVIETSSETFFLFHACIRTALCPGTIPISAHAFPTGPALTFSKAFPMLPLPGISYARSVSGNNGSSMPGNFC